MKNVLVVQIIMSQRFLNLLQNQTLPAELAAKAGFGRRLQNGQALQLSTPKICMTIIYYIIKRIGNTSANQRWTME